MQNESDFTSYDASNDASGSGQTRRRSLLDSIATLSQEQRLRLVTKTAEVLRFQLWDAGDAYDAAEHAVRNGLVPPWYLRDLDDYEPFGIITSQEMFDLVDEAAMMGWHTPEDWPLDEDEARGPDEVHRVAYRLCLHIASMVSRRLESDRRLYHAFIEGS